MEPIPTPAPPGCVLLATDLSGRCDRALDRAAQLAADWGARLVVVHALERDGAARGDGPRDEPSWRRHADARIAIAERQVREDLMGRDVPFEIAIEEGEPSDVVLRAASRSGCGLIVTGTARSETFGRMMLGATVDRLVRRAPVPVLVVKARARRPYARLMVATDFSQGAREALLLADSLFPQAAIALMHSYQPIPMMMAGRGEGDAAGRQLAAGECERFLDASGIGTEGRRRLQILIERGAVDAAVRDYAADKGLDLLVLGASGRGAVATLLLGSTAATLLASAPCDVLVARRAPAPAAAG